MSGAEIRHERLLWSTPLTWVLEDRLGARVEVDVEPATHDGFAVGERVVIEDAEYTLVAKRGRMVVTER